MGNTAGNTISSYDYTIGEEVIIGGQKPNILGEVVKKENFIVYLSEPVSIKFDYAKKEINMTQGDPRDDVYDDIYSSVETLLSVDLKEKKIIDRMAKKGYMLVGQLNEDGTYDKFASAYIKYRGTNEGLRSRARNQKAVIPSPEVSPGIYFAETLEEVKNGGKLKNDGTAFIFAYIPEFIKDSQTIKKADIMQEVFKLSASSILNDGESIADKIMKSVTSKRNN